MLAMYLQVPFMWVLFNSVIKMSWGEQDAITSAIKPSWGEQDAITSAIKLSWGEQDAKTIRAVQSNLPGVI